MWSDWRKCNGNARLQRRLQLLRLPLLLLLLLLFDSRIGSLQGAARARTQLGEVLVIQ